MVTLIYILWQCTLIFQAIYFLEYQQTDKFNYLFYPVIHSSFKKFALIYNIYLWNQEHVTPLIYYLIIITCDYHDYCIIHRGTELSVSQSWRERCFAALNADRQWPVSQSNEAGSQNKNKGCLGIDVAQPPGAWGQGLDRVISKDR